MTDTITLLQKFSDAFGVSGNETDIRDLIYSEIKDSVDEIRVDTIGNLIALKKARGDTPGSTLMKVMLAAHMDEIGFMVKQIESGGTIKFEPVGGLDPRVVLGKPVLVGKNRLPGVIGVKPIHLQEEDESKRVLKFDQLSIDVGASSKEELEGVVRIGDPIAFAASFQVIDTSTDGLRTVTGKALDDRAGCAALVALLKDDYPFDLYAVFTVQEEVGLRGARVAAYGIQPHAAFVLETTVCDDLPKKKDTSRVTQMGAGPAITIMDRSVIAARSLVRLLIETAEVEHIAYQFKSPNVGGTDAGAIHLAGTGVPSAVVSIPCRYLHAMVSMLSLNDYDRVVQLTRATLKRLTPDAIRPE